MGKEVAVKERPILFSGPMVRAILEGRKTQTRRIMKQQPQLVVGDGNKITGAQWWYDKGDFALNRKTVVNFLCPYGLVGDRLWVRETFSDLRGMGFDMPFAYRADSLKDYGSGLQEDGDSKRCRLDYGVKWTPSIHMPRVASRIALEITAVRVERLQDISEEDAKAEGIERRALDPWNRTAFMRLWQGINGPESWANNPWVWVVEFRKCS